MRKRNSSVTILAASFERISESATARIKALLKAKKARTSGLTKSRVTKILNGKHYAKRAISDIEKALDLVEDEKKVDIFVSTDGDL